MTVLRTRGRSADARAQAGLSVVELMVGVTVGLYIVAASAMLVGTQLGDNKRIVMETQIQQDLRAAGEIVARELRRAGYWRDAQQSTSASLATASSRFNQMWVDQQSGDLLPRVSGTCVEAGSTSIRFNYQATIQDLKGPYEFRVSNGALQSGAMVGSTMSYQDLTDRNSLTVTKFCVELANIGNPETLPCPSLCPAGDTACWPKVVARDLTVQISGHARNDPSVRRSMATTIRLRNDFVQFAAPEQTCP